MTNYRKMVREAALRRTGEPLYNGSLDHAAVLTEAMFEHGTQTVDIFSGRLNANAFATPEVLEKVGIFLSDPTHKVRILIEEPHYIDASDHPFIKKYSNNDDVSFKKLPTNVAEHIDYHFTVMDSDSYRFEEDKNIPSAIAAFGDNEGGMHLSTIFKQLWDASEEYDFN